MKDIHEARVELLDGGAEVSEVFHDVSGVFNRPGTEGREPGPDAAGRSYLSFASFSDPDGNGRVLQEITERFPGR